MMHRYAVDPKKKYYHLVEVMTDMGAEEIGFTAKEITKKSLYSYSMVKSFLRYMIITRIVTQKIIPLNERTGMENVRVYRLTNRAKKIKQYPASGNIC